MSAAGAAPGLAVLMYHSVGGAMPAGLEHLSVPPALLGEQLAALQDEGYELLGQSDALPARAEGRRVVALTFDDAYVDFADAALGVLGDLGAGATLYVPTRDLGGTASWLPGTGAELRLLDARQLVEAATLGVEIGSHGALHVPMDVLPRSTAAEHLRESRGVLEEIVQRPVTSFCYPHGYSSRALRRQVRAAGYDNACGIGHRLHAASGDRLAVSRLHVGPEHRPDELVDLVRTGPPALVPALKRAATPGWRLARRVARRTTGVTWT